MKVCRCMCHIVCVCYTFLRAVCMVVCACEHSLRRLRLLNRANYLFNRHKDKLRLSLDHIHTHLILQHLRDPIQSNRKCVTVKTVFECRLCRIFK